MLRLGEEEHGGRIRDTLKEFARRSVSISTVYVTLMRLEEKGFARSWKGAPTPGRGGKAKRHYEVSPEGVELLEAVRDVRDRMWQGVDSSVVGKASA